MLYVKGYWESRYGASQKLEDLGYLLSETEQGYGGVEIHPEHETLFSYKAGNPHHAGILTLLESVCPKCGVGWLSEDNLRAPYCGECKEFIGS